MGVVSQGDDRSVAAEGIKRLKDFFMSIGMPVTFKELGIDNPDIERLVAKLHEHKGERIGGYVKLSADDTIKIYEMMQ
jgi:hypothetical protein